MFKVYYTDPVTNYCYYNDCSVLIEALSTAEQYRKSGMGFVTIVSEDYNQVGKPGVDEIINGVCPDGIAYDWNKSSRIGKSR